MAAPNEQEIKLLKQFRDKISNVKDIRLNDLQKRDHYLLQWIRARDGDLEKALDMLTTSLRWREENDMDNLVRNWTPPSKFYNDCWSTFIGSTFDNEPVLFCPMGQWKIREIANRGEKDIFVKYIDWIFETALEQMEGKKDRQGNPVTQFVFVTDFAGFSFLNIACIGAIDMTLQTGRSFEANRPETLKKAYVLNAGGALMAFYNVIKHVFAQRTLEKLQFFSASSPWKEELAKEIPSHFLPTKLGGGNTSLEIGL